MSKLFYNGHVSSSQVSFYFLFTTTGKAAGLPAEHNATSEIARPSVEATPIERAPKLDGTLNDPLWQLAAPITDFRQREPDEGQPATEKTEVRILYTRHAVSFRIRCYDSAASRIVATGYAGMGKPGSRIRRLQKAPGFRRLRPVRYPRLRGRRSPPSLVPDRRSRTRRPVPSRRVPRPSSKKPRSPPRPRNPPGASPCGTGSSLPLVRDRPAAASSNDPDAARANADRDYETRILGGLRRARAEQPLATSPMLPASPRHGTTSPAAAGRRFAIDRSSSLSLSTSAPKASSLRDAVAGTRAPRSASRPTRFGRCPFSSTCRPFHAAGSRPGHLGDA